MLITAALLFIFLSNAIAEENDNECLDLKSTIGKSIISDAKHYSWFGMVGYIPPKARKPIYGCTGVAITPNHVLAPAHCVYFKEKSSAYKFYGLNVAIRVEKIFIHPLYSLETNTSNDIALLRLRKKLNCSIPLEDQVNKNSLTGRLLDVVGSNNPEAVSGSNSVNTKAFQAQAHITGQTFCQGKLRGLNVTHNEVCGYIHSGNINLKGAALLSNKMVNGTMLWHLLGISTKGIYNTPDLFTIIKPYKKWISKIVLL